jgi:pectate lyase
LVSLAASGSFATACGSSSQDDAGATANGGTHSSAVSGSGGSLARGGAVGSGGTVSNGDRGGSNNTGGIVGSGGASGSDNPGSGGASPSGGISASDGARAAVGGASKGGATTTASQSSAGAAIVGGTTSAGGAQSGGAKSAGGAQSGGAKSAGGAQSGGAKSVGGATSGGAPSAAGASSTGQQCKAIGWATRSERTGGAFDVTGGGDATPIVVKTFADLKTYAADAQPRVIHIDGTLGAGWSGTSGDRLEIKSNKTIVGLRPGTQLKAPIHISGASNVIVRNLVIRGPGSNEDQAWDNLNIEGSSKNVWIDHCEFWDGQDGNADVVKGADTVTFTWNIFGYSLPGHSHNLSNLIASSDDEPASEGKLDITYMFNWWKAAAERQPRCRYGYIHVVNNLYTADASVGASKLGVTNGFSCNVLTENNHFIDQNDPIDLGKQAGTGSVQQSVGNLFESCTGNEKGSGTAFTPPYEYKTLMVPASQVKALVQKSAGATLSSPTACN